jgi:SpoVK/Ycf46/Vps4 family AAA+-type ATPase
VQSPHGDASLEIAAYIRQTRDARLGQYARRVERLASWSSVVLPPDILDSLRELVARVRHGKTVFETWGMSRTMATSRGLTALFQGQPGTGKTLVAGVIARELGLELYQVDLSKVMSKWIGETERNLSTIFDAAEDGQVILLFDEADSLFAKRTEVRSSNDRYANLEVNYLLQRLDQFEGIAILTTNTGTSIDQAFKRRMSFRLSFPFPDEETREQLPVAGPLTLDVLARKYQLSGGYIRNACLRAAFLAAQEETSVHQRHLERAVALEFAELGKLSNSGQID